MKQLRFLVEKSIPFEAGHRLMNYEGKCKNIHGHNYIMRVGLGSYECSKQGFVRDFSEIQAVIKAYLNEFVDHATIFNIQDSEWINIFIEKKQFVYVVDNNPTAENLAAHFYHLFKTNFKELLYIEIEETPTSKARYYGE